jgi:hypothetical protein
MADKKNKEILADEYASNHEDPEVRRMYGHHYNSFIAGYDAAMGFIREVKKKIDKLEGFIVSNREELDMTTDEDDREDIENAINRLKTRKSELGFVLTIAEIE